jgi:hypothetical protein
LSAVAVGERVRLTVEGEVAGTTDGPLELYVLVDRSTAAYLQVVPGSFQLTEEVPRAAWQGDGLPPGVAAVQVDLVSGAAVWYTFRQELAPALPPEVAH